MNQLKTFNHNMFGNLQVVLVNDKEYFSATDVAKSLEYKQPHTAVKSHCNSEGVITYNVPTNGGNQDKRFITMGNVTRLIVGASKQSRSTEIKEKAKGYEKWIFDEVIPSIHATGSYSMPNNKSNNTKLLLETALKHEEEIETIKSDVVYLKETMRIDGIQEKKLQNKAKQIAIKSLGGMNSNAYKNVSRKVFSGIWRDFNNHFQLPRYSELPRKQFDEAIKFLTIWQPNTSLRIEIDELNRQLEGVI
ncbi:MULTISPECIES: ORF6C domain-containing protein [unclassified Oceanobacillus]|uniref:ORF6C domain-containing protein n=1 Tax=unclassified Oceanobacillus TaxID=2630292 RepID=UPI001BE78533|nr:MULTISPECIES: ORF6C domain-containing protein [unclassified Oceanobacillus]MBT2601249.1 ORF6C domain-containing protein [Oceanobacillus sp. ISL-74]MBT2653645.1 ORF6C domain-containing protein [Oceanobacillus sp. ISL-73]